MIVDLSNSQLRILQYAYASVAKKITASHLLRDPEAVVII
jgi:hypothetical protein